MLNSQKAHALFRWTFDRQLKQQNILPEGNDQNDWKSLQSVFSKKYSVELPPFSEKSPESMLWGMIHQMTPLLVQDSRTLEKYAPEAYIRSGTDLYWSQYPPSIPLTRRVEQLSFSTSKIQYILDQFEEKLPKPQLTSHSDQEAVNYAMYSGEEDALAAHLLALRYLSSQTMIHEIGCWNGSNLINFLHLARLHNQKPSSCIGTDINHPALNFAHLTSQMLGLSNPQFYCAHALTPIDPSKLGFEGNKILRLALRVIPVLDLASAKEFLKTNCLRDKDVVLVLSYATRKGQSYENNLAKSSEKGGYEYRAEEFDGGVTFYAPFPDPELYKKYRLEVVANTYYDTKGFQSLISNLGLHISDKITVGRFSDNEREVVSITPV
ncbi:MAG: hypothetical protein AB7O96_00170 [Pseudobdellovibrionaceae bacterium]